MTSPSRSTSLAWLFAATALVFLARLPFLTPGYGYDRDNWRTATAARLIDETGLYHESRTPGHPVQEWTCSRLWRGGPAALNGATAAASAVAVLFFGLCFLELGGGPWSAAAALALGFTPIVYIHSVDAMDYLWALSFSMVALWLTLRRLWLGAGVALGLAIGCRITAGLLLFPLLLLGRARGWKGGALVGLGVTTLVAAGMLYLPNFVAYGTEFIRASRAPYPRPLRLVQDMTLELWGLVGCAGLAAAFWLASRRRGPPVLGSNAWIGGAALALILYVAAFLWLPDEPAYLIPTVPFVILFLARVSRPAVFAAACACLVVSPFVFDLGRPENARPGEIALPGRRPLLVLRPAEGPLLVDRRQRVCGMRNGEKLLAEILELRGPAMVVCAVWHEQMVEMGHGKLPENVRLTEYLRGGEADSLFRSGYRFYYVRGSEASSMAYGHVDLASLGARPLRFEPAP